MITLTIVIITSNGASSRLGVPWSDAFDGPVGHTLLMRDSPHDLVGGWIHAGVIGVLRLQRVVFAEEEGWGVILTPEAKAKLMGRA